MCIPTVLPYLHQEQWQWMPEGSWSLSAIFHLSSKHRVCAALILPGGKQLCLSKGTRGEARKALLRVFLQSILLDLLLKSLFSGLQELNCHPYINSKELLKSLEIFQGFGCSWICWNSCWFFILLLDSLQYWLWEKEPAACGTLALSSQKAEHIGLCISCLFKNKKKKNLLKNLKKTGQPAMFILLLELLRWQVFEKDFKYYKWFDLESCLIICLVN